jgi:succinyl-CoA synthetase beta subunit
MNVHEYQGKEILNFFGVSTPKSFLATTEQEAFEAAKSLSVNFSCLESYVIKAQVHAGGRGKCGGVQLAKNLKEVREKAHKILGMYLVTPQTSEKGKLVRKVLVSEDVYDHEVKEYYISIFLNRSLGKNMILYSPEGGMDIESVSKEKVKTEIIDSEEMKAFQARKIAFNLHLKGKAFKAFVKFITSLYRAYVKSDASLLEINPMIKTYDDRILAVDAKVVIDENALFRHSDYATMRDDQEENEVEASKAGLNFVKLNGNVACMVNGAGLAMATMDMIKFSGGSPANFLDIGGTADDKRIENAFSIILKDVDVILINIFGGIVRCDLVARGIITAYKKYLCKIPIVIRLKGTNFERSMEIIRGDCGLHFHSVNSLKEAAEKLKTLYG